MVHYMKVRYEWKLSRKRLKRLFLSVSHSFKDSIDPINTAQAICSKNNSTAPVNTAVYLHVQRI